MRDVIFSDMLCYFKPEILSYDNIQIALVIRKLCNYTQLLPKSQILKKDFFKKLFK